MYTNKLLANMSRTQTLACVMYIIYFIFFLSQEGNINENISANTTLYYDKKNSIDRTKVMIYTYRVDI